MAPMSDQPRLNAMFHRYSELDIVSATKSEEAFASDVYDVVTSNGERYFMKILRSQDPSVIATEAAMQQRLLAAGIATPQYIEMSPGLYVGTHNNERFLLSKYIPGRSPEMVTPKLIESLGATLARLHDCLDGIVIPKNDMQWLNPEKVQHDLDAYDGKMKRTLTELVDYGSTIFASNLPLAVTHGDLWLSNVFAENDQVTTVFDLETAGETVRLVDIARTYTSIRFNSQFSADDVLRGLVTGYDSATTHPLTAEEHAHIHRAIAYVCGACATWHAVHGTRYAEPYIAFGTESMVK